MTMPPGPGDHPGFPNPGFPNHGAPNPGFGGRPFGSPARPPAPTGPNPQGAGMRALIGGGAIGLVALVFVFLFWPVAILLFAVAALYTVLLGTGMDPFAGTSTTIAHVGYLWRTRVATAGASPPAQRFPNPPTGQQFPNPPTGQQFPSPPTGQQFPSPPTGPRGVDIPPPVDPPTEIVARPTTPGHGFTAAQAADPATDPAVLAQIAATASDLHIYLAANPATYPDLLDWLAAHGAPEARDAVARRRHG
ncbi:hypothetical protein [Gordonia polyisoprenivorans]|uniref:variant leucine-rich repeat-containing protein n=1 Tax=Gordonia polyisoprenivorans TaxID=84595 RepID=UPI001AD7B6C1|nr:hypothetical protein [Gordonia polyisoprenivorans]QTI68327.1 hypothetical protein J6U32_22960 [Gordonia polyisoprenivorans]